MLRHKYKVATEQVGENLLFNNLTSLSGGKYLFLYFLEIAFNNHISWTD